MNRQPLENRNVLFICPKFFGYENDIADKLREFGASVDLYDERPSSNVFAKAVLKFFSAALSAFTRLHYAKILRRAESRRYDYIFVIKGALLTAEFIDRLKSLQGNARFLMYQWDSIKNNTNVISLLNRFDAVFTFDRHDARKYGFTFRPLFYNDAYAARRREDDRHDPRDRYDLLFIGTVHTDRFIFLSRILEFFAARPVFVYMYYYSPLIFIVRKLFDRAFRGARMRDFSFSPLGKEETVGKMLQSGIVIDIQHPDQTGLTMRTVESLGAGKKLITTNDEIMRYDFYDPANICVVSRTDPVVPETFISASGRDVPADVYKRYSIGYFVREIFGISRGL